MAFFPPEHPESPLKATPPEQAGAEPRLLTRRDAEPSPDVPSPNVPPLKAPPVRRRERRFHPLRSLSGLRTRLAASRMGEHESSTKDPHPSGTSSAEPRTHRRFLRLLRRALVSVFVLVILCALALVSFALFLRRDMHAALPQLDGDLHLAGLTAPVTVTRDERGVPSLQAATLDDLLFAQGFVTAQDRLWQMDALRRHAAGELAEILGPSMVEHDRGERILQLRAAADRAVLTLPTDQLAQLQAYARGVNAFLEGNADRLPVEFHLLHYRPAPWTPRDSLLVSLAMFQDLATTFPTKLRREAFAQHLPPELLADLYPTRSWRDQPPTQPPSDLTAPQPEVLQIPLDDSQVKLHRPRFDPQLATQSDLLDPHVFEQHCLECRAGSNNWAVSGQRSASGKPLVSNDMHLGLSVPDIWYEAGLHTTGSAADPALDVTGFTLPGVPFVIVGRNAHVAWGVTNLGADVQDLHIEHLRGTGDATEFQQPDSSWAPVAHHRELIRVRGGHDQVLDVLSTFTHIGGASTDAIATPIISPLYPTERRAISLLWTPYDPRNLTSPFYAVNAATSGAALVASLASFGGPSLNLVYADDAGHIGYHALGRIPIRGPAVHHPRALPAEAVPPTGAQPGAAPPDEDPTGESDVPPQARSDFAAPHFLNAGYVRRRPRRVNGTRKPERGPAAKPLPEAPTAKPLQEVPLVPAPALHDYTVGSPLPAVPIDGLDAAAQWSGYVPYEELPSILNPADGILATANARVTADDYPYFLADEWAPPFRVERIRKLLAGRTGLTPADMLAIETDTTSAFDRLLGERLTYALDHASAHALGRDVWRLHAAADQLRVWTGNMSVDSPAAAIVTAARPAILSMLLTAQIARHDGLPLSDPRLPRLVALYDWASQSTALETLLTFQPARWLPPGFSSWNDFLATAAERGLMATGAPRDLSRWRYGSLHQVDIEHPVFSLSPLLGRLLGARTGTGPQPTGGDGTTIKAIGRTFGPSERFTADLADPAATTGNITTGQSGNPASPHYLDQFSAWLHGTTFALPVAGAPAQHTLHLLP